MTKLYHHKTDGGAEYLTDTFIAWKHNGKKGKEGTITHETKICVRLDGQPELLRADNAALIEALEDCLKIVDRYRATHLGDGDICAMNARAALAQAEG